MNSIFLFAGAALSLGWGIAHLFPTGNVVRGFGNISTDNKHILRMEWIIEGVTLIFIGMLTAMITFADSTAWISRLVYLLISVFLIVLAIISFFTGFKVRFIAYKFCPFVFMVSSAFILLGGVVLQAEQDPTDNKVEFKIEIREAERAFARMAKEKGVKEAFLHYAADSAVMMRGNKIINGKEAIRDYHDLLTLSDIYLNWEPDFVEVSSSGDLAYTYGPFSFSAVDADGQKIEADGIFHTVWKRQEDGSWKFVYD